uniref:Uncharacterized protein n=1 Tax=Arundo donax TaxID=35708 RepID=A0A0A9GXM6_ARUDO
MDVIYLLLHHGRIHNLARYMYL